MAFKMAHPAEIDHGLPIDRSNSSKRRPSEFIDENSGGPGVRLPKQHQKKG
jgi:hypothetical protein